jgi:hypothetical protein
MNLPPYMMGVLALKLEESIAARAKAKELVRKTTMPKSAQSNMEQISTREELAKLAGIGKSQLSQIKPATAKRKVMLLTPQQASYFLANYPALSREYQNKREDIIQGYRQGAIAGGIKPSGHSDPTAKKAVLLMDNSETEAILDNIRLWIDTKLPQKDRQLLIITWRLGSFGWHWVAKDLGMEVDYCRRRWKALTQQLAAHLNLSAGLAPAPPGNVCATSPMSQ